MIKDLKVEKFVTADGKGVRERWRFGIDFEGLTGECKPQRRVTGEKASCGAIFTNHDSMELVRCQQLFV
jgi:hypothetical protein